MSNRFHNKFHRHNHHTTPTDRGGKYPDSAYDPIASPEAPFRGEFYVDGNITTLSSVSAHGDVIGYNGLFHNDLTVEGNFTVLGTVSHLDTLVYSSSAVEISNTGTGPALKVSQSGTNPIAHFIDTNGDDIVFDDNGNVGIGTYTPNEKLTVVGNISSTGTATIKTIDTGSTDSVIIESSGLLQKRDTNSAIWDTSARYISASDTNLNTGYIPKAGNLFGIEDSVIFDDGTNVGIGETAPEGKLHVKTGSAGSVTAQPNSIGIFESSSNAYVSILAPNAQYAGVVMGGPNNPYGAYMSWNHDNSALKVATAHSQGSIQFLVNTEQEAVRILSGGNVGIGTTNPKEKLTVSGNLSTSGTAVIGTIDTNSTNTSVVVESNGLLQKRVLNIAATDTTSRFVSASDGDLTVNYLTKATNSNGINESIISDNGNLVYVGGNLTISGNLTALGNSYFANTLFTTTSSISVVNNGPGPALYVYQGPGVSDVASFYDGDGIEVLHIGNCDPGQQFGKIGINTGTPNKELTVKGSISASGTLNLDTVNVNSSSDSILVLGTNNILEKRTVDSRTWGTSLVDGTGTTNYVTKWSDNNTVTDSIIFDNGTTVTAKGALSSTGNFTSNGTATIGTIATGTTDSVIIESSGTLQKRTIDSRIWGSSSLVDGSGTQDYVTKWSDSNTVTVSIIFDNGTTVTAKGALSSTGNFTSNGTATIGTVNTNTTSNSIYVLGTNNVLEKRTIDSTAWNPGATYQPIITGAATTIVSSNLATSMALVSDSNGKVAASSTITSTELGYLDGVTSAVQTQLNGKQNSWGVPFCISSVTPQSTTTLPQCNDVEFTGHGAEVTIASFNGGVRGVTYTLTNKGSYNVIISSTSTVFVRGGNTWTSSACASYSGKIILPPKHSCSLRADSATDVSVW